MRRFVVAPAAEQDIAAILAWTQEHFGEKARLRYEVLLIQAITDVVNKPDLPGSILRPEIADSLRSFHLFHSRNAVARAVGRVKKPRHFLLYRSRADGLLEIGRVLHDSVDLDRHVPGEYRRHLGLSDN